MNINHNSIRLANPLNVKCGCVKSIASDILGIVNNNLSVRDKNKAFLLKRLGDEMENTMRACVHENIPSLTKAYEIGNRIRLEKGQRTNINTVLKEKGGFCIYMDDNKIITNISYVRLYDNDMMRADLSSESVEPGLSVFNEFTYPPTDECVEKLRKSDIKGGMSMNDLNADVISWNGNAPITIIQYAFI